MATNKTKAILEMAGIPLDVYERLPSMTKIAVATQCRRWGKTVKDFPQYFDPLVVWIKTGKEAQE